VCLVGNVLLLILNYFSSFSCNSLLKVRCGGYLVGHVFVLFFLVSFSEFRGQRSALNSNLYPFFSVLFLAESPLWRIFSGQCIVLNSKLFQFFLVLFGVFSGRQFAVSPSADSPLS
jgi:hypothetical protein